MEKFTESFMSKRIEVNSIKFDIITEIQYNGSRDAESVKLHLPSIFH